MQGEKFIGRFEHIFHGYLNEDLHLHLKRLQKSFFFFFGRRDNFSLHIYYKLPQIYVAICVIGTVTIPEPFEHSRGIRLLATHSLHISQLLSSALRLG